MSAIIKILAPYVAVGYKDGVLNLGYGSINTQIEDPALQKVLLEICKFFKVPHLLSEFKSDFYSLEQVDEAFALLISGHFIVDYNMLDLPDEASNRLSLYVLSQGKNPKVVLDELSLKKITIIGCGAIGTEVALLLATLGIKHFILADYDKYNLVNIGRSVNITPELVGQNKAIALSNLISRKNSDSECYALSERVNEENCKKLFATDLVVLSADAIYLLDQINYYSVKEEVPFLQIGYAHDLAVWGPFVSPKKSGCIMCRRKTLARTTLTQSQVENIKSINTGYISPAPAHIVQLAVSLGVNDILRYFLGQTPQSLNRQLAFSPTSLGIHEMLYNQTADCNVCGAKSEIKD